MLKAARHQPKTPPASVIRWLAVFFVFVMGWHAQAHAQDEELEVDPPKQVAAGVLPPQPKHALQYVNATFARANPIGMGNIFEMVYQTRLYESEKNALKQNFFGVGPSTLLAPALGRVGLLVNVQPLTLLQVYGRFSFVRYFGTMNLLASFPGADAEFSDQVIADRADKPGTENYASSGAEFNSGIMLRGIRFGPIALRDHFRTYYTHYDLRDGDTVKYEQRLDLLMPNKGWSLVNDFDVMWVVDGRFILTARWTYLQGLYGDQHYTGGVRPSNAPSNVIHRLGPVFSYVFSRSPGSKFDAPTLSLAAQWHLAHRYRAGQEVSQAIPQVGLSFQFTGDFLSDR